jgi:hypothetical protein
MLRHTLKSLLSLLLFFGLLITSFQVLAVTVTVSPSTFTPSPGCTTALTEWGFPSGMNFYDFNGTDNQTVAGSLCPGTYQVTGYCTVNVGGGCSGSSCGWGVSVYAWPIAGGGNVNIVSQSGHDGCTHNHGNPCESQTYHDWTSVGSFSTKKYQNLYLSVYTESGNVQSCILSAQYTGPA